MNDTVVQFGKKVEAFITLCVKWLLAKAHWIIVGFVGAVILALLATAISVLSGHFFIEVLEVLKLTDGDKAQKWLEFAKSGLFQTYVLLIVAFIFLFGLREHLTTTSVKKERYKLYQTIRSMPPVGIMVKFKKLYDGATNYIAGNTIGKAYESKPTDERLSAIDDSIRLCSDALSSLAYAFQRNDKARFAGNVMTYHPVDTLDDSDREIVLELLSGVIDSYSFEGLDGYLMLDKALTSSTSTDDSFATDEFAENMALPIPKTVYSRHNKNLLRLLPGAPHALAFGDYIIDDTHTLKAEINETCDFPASIGDNIHRYFTETKPGKQVRSFISMRLTRYNEETEQQSPLGVVNVHCDQVKLFADDDNARSFIALSQPFLDLIAKLVFRRNQLQS